MLFNRQLNATAEMEMKQCTQSLIDAVLQIKGTYYLPYRPHATRAQFYRAYPMAEQFFSLKDKYDSTELFYNLFYKNYR